MISTKNSTHHHHSTIEVPPILQQIAKATALNYSSASTRNEMIRI
jgi:hypothetical protein